MDRAGAGNDWRNSVWKMCSGSADNQGIFWCHSHSIDDIALWPLRDAVTMPGAPPAPEMRLALAENDSVPRFVFELRAKDGEPEIAGIGRGKPDNQAPAEGLSDMQDWRRLTGGSLVMHWAPAASPETGGRMLRSSRSSCFGKGFVILPS